MTLLRLSFYYSLTRCVFLTILVDSLAYICLMENMWQGRRDGDTTVVPSVEDAAPVNGVDSDKKTSKHPLSSRSIVMISVSITSGFDALVHCIYNLQALVKDVAWMEEKLHWWWGLVRGGVRKPTRSAYLQASTKRWRCLDPKPLFSHFSNSDKKSNIWRRRARNLSIWQDTPDRR
jgi:hypothetical protein